MGLQEGKIERRLRSGVKALGGICFKLSPSVDNGIPDRLAVWPNGTTHFVELKAPNGTLSAIQAQQHRRLRKRGQIVVVPWSIKEVDAYLLAMRKTLFP